MRPNNVSQASRRVGVGNKNVIEKKSSKKEEERKNGRIKSSAQDRFGN